MQMTAALMPAGQQTSVRAGAGAGGSHRVNVEPVPGPSLATSRN